MSHSRQACGRSRREDEVIGNNDRSHLDRWDAELIFLRHRSVAHLSPLSDECSEFVLIFGLHIRVCLAVEWLNEGEEFQSRFRIITELP